MVLSNERTLKDERHKRTLCASMLCIMLAPWRRRINAPAIKKQFSYYTLYPTLIKGSTQCNIALNEDESGKLEFVTITGKKINEYQLSEGNNTISFGSQVSSGVYLYKIWVQNQLKVTGKIIKIE